MLNLHTDALDKMDEQELYLTLQIARHIGRNGSAWPGMKRLISLTGWTKNTVLKVRQRCESKGYISTLRRANNEGMSMSNLYRLTTPHISVYVPSSDISDDGINRGAANEPLINKGVHNMNGGGAGNEPEVLSNEVLSMVGKVGKTHLQNLIDAEPLTPEQIDTALPNSVSVKKEKGSAKKEKDGPVTIETARRRDAAIREMSGAAPTTTDEARTAPAPLTIEQATTAIMAEIETTEGQRKLKFAAGRGGVNPMPKNLLAAVARYAEHRAEQGREIHTDPIYRLGGYLRSQASNEAKQIENKTYYSKKPTNAKFQPNDNPATYDYDNLPAFN
jgi:hypothetical protein